jgi:hypothetical protein
MPSSSPGSTNPWNGDSVAGGSGSEAESGGPDGPGPPWAIAGIATAGVPDAPGAGNPLGEGNADGVADAPGRRLGAGSGIEGCDVGRSVGKDVGRGSDGRTDGNAVGVGNVMGSDGRTDGSGNDGSTVGSGGRVGVATGSGGSVGVATGSGGSVGVATGSGGSVGVATGSGGSVGVATGRVGSSIAGAPAERADCSSARANTALGITRPTTSATIAERDPDAECRIRRPARRVSTGQRDCDWRPAWALPGSTPFP